MATHITYTDSGAPQVDGADPQTIIDIFEYCLVTNGNWTMPYTNASPPGAVFLRPDGNFYFQLEESPDTSTSNFMCTMFKTMTAFDTGTEKSPVSTSTSTRTYLRYNTTTSNFGTHWDMFFDDNFFIFHLNYSSTFTQYDNTTTIMFGTLLNSPIVADPYNCFILGRNNAGSSNLYDVSAQLSTSTSAGLNGQWMIRNGLSAVNPVKIGKYATNGFGGNYIGANNSAEFLDDSGKSSLGKVYIKDADNYIRGYIPGLISFPYNRVFEPYSTQKLIYDEQVIDAKFFYQYSTASYFLTAAAPFWSDE